MKSYEICICGAGHQGLSMAAHLALNDTHITLWNRTQSRIREVIENRKIFCRGVIEGSATIEKASSDISEVIKDVVMVTAPSTAHRDIAKVISRYVHKDMIIILNPGRTFGAIEFAEELTNNGVGILPHIAETQSIAYTCRSLCSNTTEIYAIKKGIAISSIREDDISYILDRIPFCLRSCFIPVSSIAYTSLSNVGMILHCAPVIMNTGWIESDKEDFKYYYDGISFSVACFLEKLDTERLNVANAMGFKIESVSDWLKRVYNVYGDNMYECIRNNNAYKKIDAPHSLDTRYITEDVPNGLVPVEYIAKEYGVSTHNISLVIDMASTIMNTDYRKIGRTYNISQLKKYI